MVSVVCILGIPLCHVRWFRFFFELSKQLNGWTLVKITTLHLIEIFFISFKSGSTLSLSQLTTDTPTSPRITLYTSYKGDHFNVG
ncbi:hypothetical protein HanRHA438_Chr05g0212001 [Helianthus annuus]|nr:hypothetical protein HanRHA438_Chr05g0212001 [Helianthus annuus]